MDNTLGTAITDEYGTATVSFVLPSTVPAGVQHLTVTGAQTGTTTTVPVTVSRARDHHDDARRLGDEPDRTARARRPP